MKHAITFLLGCCFISLHGLTQNQHIINTDSVVRYYYPNGNLSSEGTLREGKPDGYWKNYYENGLLKSEGNRENFELNGIWKFYSEEGRLTLDIAYRNDKKEGLRNIYLESGKISEQFIADVKQGNTIHYYPNGRIKLTIPFKNGFEDGYGMEYDTTGLIITLFEYKKGFMVDRTRINRHDHHKLKHGKWMEFYPEGRIRHEGTYKSGKKHGYFKEYDKEGGLTSVQKYVDDVLQIDAPETQNLVVRKEYYPGGQVKISATYKDSLPEGIWRVYDTTGIITESYIYHEGKIIGSGIFLEDGNMHGPWKEFYPDGTLKAEGSYLNGKKTGAWKYLHPNGKLEQTGVYDQIGRFQGTWKWFFDDGKLRIEEQYSHGKKDGLSSEYDEKGRAIATGEYINDLEDAFWFVETGDFREEGSYRDGLRNGWWNHYFLAWDSLDQVKKTMVFEGNFIDDLPDGKHRFWYPDGTLKEAGNYILGKKEGDWSYYTEDGLLYLTITYRNGTEVKFDGIKIKPPYEPIEP